MLALNLGPLALPVGPLLLAAAMLVAAIAGRLAAGRSGSGIGAALSDLLLAGLFAARLAFVVQWFDAYREAPWTVLDIRDGGFTPAAGIAAALALAAWLAWRRPAQRRPLLAGMVAGALAWAGLHAAWRAAQAGRAPGWPEVTLATLDGADVRLAALAAGRPMVVNLWATWCAPCRREMPVLTAAQRRESGIVFVFVDQGETPATVRRYLDATGLALANVLLDAPGALARSVDSSGLPTTLFYDAEGRLVDAHVGMLSAATLASRLARLK